MDQQSFKEIAQGAVVAATPQWVDVAPYPVPATPNPHFITNGVCILLDDSQIELTGEDRALYARRATMVTASAGTELAAQFSVSFDPNFERVEVHSIAVIRKGERTEHAASAFYEVLRRERNLERLQFDGRLTAHVTIPDVRVGDIVETSYTRYGVRKAMGGRHSHWVAFDWGVGLVEVRVRQRAPASRTIKERAVGDVPTAVETSEGGIVDRRWRTYERPAFKFEQLTPPWIIQGASLQWSEWKDWQEVASAMTPLYEHSGELPEDARAEVDRIAATHKKPAEKAAAVLRFAQSEVRYLAISMGEGGYTPRSLSDVCQTRYGDCKDKSKLFVAMARALGLDACPALVNTVDGYMLNECLPSGQLFDHCIVRLAIDKSVYWLDPTRQTQPSPLDKLSQCHFGWGLPLKNGAAQLERMSDPAVLHLTETHEKVTLGNKPDVPVRYEWEHKFRHIRAEIAREQFAREGTIGVFRGYAEDIQRTWPKATVVSQEIVSDDVESNTLTVREVYEIHDAWEHVSDQTYQFQTRDLTLRGTLAPLDPSDRRYAIHLGQPGRRTRHVDVHTAIKHQGGWSRRAGNETLSFSDELRCVSSNWLVLDQILNINGMTLRPGDVDTYRQVFTCTAQNDLVITEKLRGKKFVNRKSGGGESGGVWDTLRWIWIVGVVLALLARCATYQ